MCIRDRFDTYQVGPRSIDVHKTVTEKRAPTDESVRLLREMEAKAKDQVIEAMRLTSSSVEAVAHRYDNPMDMRTHFLIHYKLNGQKREVRLHIEEYKSSIEEQLDAIWKAIAEDMAAVLVGDVARTVVRR